LSEYKKQHYLPKFYLNNFSYVEKFNDKNQNIIWYYNKKQKIIRRKSTENIAYKSYYYSFKTTNDEYDLSVEKYFSKLENETAEIIRKIENDSNVIIKNLTKTGKRDNISRKLNENEKQILLIFIFYMWKRVPAFVNELEKEWGKEYNKSLKENKRTFNYNEFKEQIIELMMGIGTSSQNNFLNLFNIKNITFLYNNFDDVSIITTDNPFIRRNLNGPDGLNYPETNIFFPLSKKIILFLHHLGKKIDIKKIPSKKHLFDLNLDIAERAYDFIYSDNEIHLKKILKKLKLDIL